MGNAIIPLPIFTACIILLGISAVLLLTRKLEEDKKLALYSRLRNAIVSCLFVEDKVSIISADSHEDAKLKYTAEMNRLRRDPETSEVLLSLLGIPQMGDVVDISSPEWKLDQSGNIVITMFYKQYAISPNSTEEDYQKAVSEFLAFGKSKE